MKKLYDNIFVVLNVDSVLYCLLFTVTLSVNKFVLSTLKFTYPTVFQGWQTLVASLFMFLLKTCTKEKYKESVHGPGVINLLPNLFFHVLQLVAGSKALSAIPVPVFLSVTNIANAAVYLGLNKATDRLQFLAGGVVLITSGFMLLLKNNGISDVAVVWLLTHIFFYTCDTFYSSNIDMKYNRLSRLCYVNFFSVVILVPASLYLNEAFYALEFASTNKLQFYVSIILSGICGGVTQVQSLSLHSGKMSHSVAVAFAALFAYAIFKEDTLSHPVLHVVSVNIAANFILSITDRLQTSDRSKLEINVI